MWSCWELPSVAIRIRLWTLGRSFRPVATPAKGVDRLIAPFDFAHFQFSPRASYETCFIHSDSIKTSLRSGLKSKMLTLIPRFRMALIISLHFFGEGQASPRLILAIILESGLYPTSLAISLGSLMFIKYRIYQCFQNVKDFFYRAAKLFLGGVMIFLDNGKPGDYKGNHQHRGAWPGRALSPNGCDMN